MKESRKLEMTPGWVKSVRPAATAIDYRDTAERGLVLRVERSGLKTWVYRYTHNGRDRRFRIGDTAKVTLKAARAVVRARGAEVEKGIDVQAARKAERDKGRIGEMVDRAVASWLGDDRAGPARKWKGGLEGGTARCFIPHIRRFADEFKGTRVAELTPEAIERFVAAAGSRGGAAPATLNRKLTAVRQFLAWAGKKKLIPRATAIELTEEIEKEPEQERQRVLTDDELRAVIFGFDVTRYGAAVRFLVLTALRRDEALGARWSWMDLEAGVMEIPPEAEKTGRGRGEPRRVALSPAAVALLAAQREALFAAGIKPDPDQYVFAVRLRTRQGTIVSRPPSWALQARLNELRGLRSNGQPRASEVPAGPAPLATPEGVLAATIHDVRRTVANALLSRLEVQQWTVDHVILGHTRPKLLRTYAPTLPLTEARAGLARWAEEVQRILDAKPAAVSQAR